MNCEWLERVAIAMDGEWSPELEGHVAGCAECRALLSDRELLREAPEIAPEVYDAVRERAMGQIRPTNNWWWRAAAAVLLIGLGTGWWVTRVPDVQRLEVAVSAPQAPEVRKSPPPQVERSVPVRRAPAAKPDSVRLALELRQQLAPAPAALRGEVAIAMQTEDPNVVILLVPETGGGE